MLGPLAKYPKLIYYKNVRRNLHKYFFAFIIFIVIFAIKQNLTYAAAHITATQESSPQPTSLTGVNLTRWSKSVNENTDSVKVEFSGLNPDITYKACLRKNPEDCSGGDHLKDLPSGSISTVGTSTPNGSGLVTNRIIITLYVCGDGDKNLKLTKDSSSNCGTGDYFHAGSIYFISLFNKDAPTAALETASFYVNRYYPKIDIQPENPTPGTLFDVKITGTRRPHDNRTRNNTFIGLKNSRNDTIDHYCIEVQEDGKNEMIWPEDDSDGVINFSVPEGDYSLEIQDQVKEEGGGFQFTDTADCEGGFTFYRALIKVRSDGKGSIELTADPNGQDIAANFGNEHKAPPPPCDERLDSPSANCTKINTAIGPVNTDPSGFVKSVFSLVLGLAGGLAILLIIYSGFQLIESRGNPEKLESAREQLTSAIIGLLFIIFSLVVIQFLGVDILKLPGLGR